MSVCQSVRTSRSRNLKTLSTGIFNRNPNCVVLCPRFNDYVWFWVLGFMPPPFMGAMLWFTLLSISYSLTHAHTQLNDLWKRLIFSLLTYFADFVAQFCNAWRAPQCTLEIGMRLAYGYLYRHWICWTPDLGRGSAAGGPHFPSPSRCCCIYMSTRPCMGREHSIA